MASLGEVAAYWAVESEVFKAVSPLPPGGLPAGTSLLDPDAPLRSHRSKSGYGWGVKPKGKRRKAR